MERWKLFAVFRVFLVVLFIPGSVLQASYVYPLEIFTSNGAYYDSAELDMYVVVSSGPGAVDFTFYNENLIDSSLTDIYFDSDSLLGISSVTSGPGTSFSQLAAPGDLPGRNLLDPPFATTGDFCIDGDPPVSHNGVEPTEPGAPLEWVKVSFDLINGGTLSAVVDELNEGVLRIGAHVIALPDGSSESAANVPEPGVVLLFGSGGLALLRRKR